MIVAVRAAFACNDPLTMVDHVLLIAASYTYILLQDAKGYGQRCRFGRTLASGYVCFLSPSGVQCDTATVYMILSVPTSHLACFEKITASNEMPTPANHDVQ